MARRDYGKPSMAMEIVNEAVDTAMRDEAAVICPVCGQQGLFALVGKSDPDLPPAPFLVLVGCGCPPPGHILVGDALLICSLYEHAISDHQFDIIQ